MMTRELFVFGHEWYIHLDIIRKARIDRAFHLCGFVEGLCRPPHIFMKTNVAEPDQP